MNDRKVQKVIYFTTTVQGNETKRKKSAEMLSYKSSFENSFMKTGEEYFELCSRCMLTQAVVPIAGVLLTALESLCKWVTN